MGRRRRFIPKRGGPRRQSGSGPRKRKLNMRTSSSFEYELKQILADVEMGTAIFGNVYSKANNIGIAEAEEYVESIADEGNIERAKADEILGLLNRSGKMR